MKTRFCSTRCYKSCCRGWLRWSTKVSGKASLSLSAARRIVEADEFMRAGLYDGWLPNLFVGNLLKGQTVGVIGAGRIGSAYARMMGKEFKLAFGEKANIG
ncbi:hypothetical protein CerSpe_240040 [Prunus speciosa]